MSVLDSFTILSLEGTHFFMMPGEGSGEGDGSSSSDSGGLWTPVGVEVGSLQLFVVKGELHSRFRSDGQNGKERFNCTCLVKGSQMVRRNVVCYFTQPGLM